MAACASGASTASAVMCSEIGPCSGCSACTVTCVSGAASFLQPVTRTSDAASIKIPHWQRYRAGAKQAAEKLGTEGGGGLNPRIKPAESAGFSPGTTVLRDLLEKIRPFSAASLAPATAFEPILPASSRSALLVLIFLIGSHRSRQCFKIVSRRLVAHSSIFARILRAQKCGLRVHYLEHGCFAGCVAQPGQMQALRRRGHARIERCKLPERCRGLGIGFVQPRQKSPLRCRQRHPGGLAANLALLHLVLRR